MRHFKSNELVDSGNYQLTLPENRPTWYPFNLTYPGSGAPRFQDGRVIASRAWKQLSPYETHWTPYQRKEFGQAQQVNASLVEQAAKRKEQRRQEQLAKSEPYNPWGQGYGNRGFGESYQRHKLNDIIN